MRRWFEVEVRIELSGAVTALVHRSLRLSLSHLIIAIKLDLLRLNRDPFLRLPQIRLPVHWCLVSLFHFEFGDTPASRFSPSGPSHLPSSCRLCLYLHHHVLSKPNPGLDRLTNPLSSCRSCNNSTISFQGPWCGLTV